MAFKRRLGSGRGGPRRKRARFSSVSRPVVRMSKKGRMRIRGTTNVMTVHRWLLPGQITIGAGSNSYRVAYAPNVGQLPDITQFASLFDQFRLLKVIFQVRMVNNPNLLQEPNSSTSPGIGFYPDVYVTVDHDDSSLPTDPNYMMQYSKCKSGILKPNTWFTYSCRPTTNKQLYLTSATTSYAIEKNTTWIDIANSSTPYYGIKMVIDCSSALAGNLLANPCYFEQRMKFIVQFKNQR